MPAQLRDPLGSVRERIPALARCTYLNTGTNGPHPYKVLDAEREWLDALMGAGLAGFDMMARRANVMVGARRALAELLSAAPESIALTASTTEGLNWALEALRWREGDELLVPAGEYPSLVLACHLRARRYGVVVRTVDLEGDGEDAAPDPLKALDAARSHRTRAIVFSHVRYDTGRRRDAEAICRWATQRGVASVVDGAQAVGAVPVDLPALGCDFYALPGQKWLLAPEGTGGLYVREDVVTELLPPQVGYLGVVDFDDRPEFRFKASASRFLAAFPNTGTWSGFQAALGWLDALDAEATFERIADLASSLKAMLADVPGVRVLTPRAPEASAGLVSFSLDGPRDYEAIAQRWYREHDLLVRSIPARGRETVALRASTHYFNTEGELERLVGLVERLARSGG